MTILTIVAIAVVHVTVVGSVLFDCPTDWHAYDNVCYKFVYYPKQTYSNAEAECSLDSASLVSVNSGRENSFINNYLQRNDPFRNSWYTSGSKKDSSPEEFRWEGDYSDVLVDSQFWLPQRQYMKGNKIIYAYEGATYGWKLAFGLNTSLSYICEISQAEAYRIVQKHRDFSFGSNEFSENEIERGPSFVEEPQSVIVVGGFRLMYMECIARGVPQPTYKWYRGNQFSTEVTSEMDRRYTLTSGRLTIQNPEEVTDLDEYRCEVENSFGRIFSNPVSFSFGYLGDFSNVQNAPVRANAYQGAVIECSDISYKPAVVYNWLKSTTQQYLFPELVPYIFISNNGKLYFTEVGRSDESDYYCVVSLTGLSSANLGTSQSPSRTSMPIRLIVGDQAAKAEWGPEIQNDFISVYPQPPLRGQDVRFECFAYGSAKNYEEFWTYSWSREGVGHHMPEHVIFRDFHRVMIINNARLEDQGDYRCTVRRGVSGSDTRVFTLRLEAKPYFSSKLKDQHLDIGGQVTWRCEAVASPTPDYAWFKNGVQIGSSGNVQVTGNVLNIQNLSPEQNDGMYQCVAHNIHGTSTSTAQLRVMSFAPSFVKHPMEQHVVGALRGNVTIVCEPEAAPTATISWTKQGGQLNLPTGGEGRVRKLQNGNLVITDLQMGDYGQYRCTAENVNGQATSFTLLSVSTSTSITRVPQPKVTVHINDTAFLYCQASADPKLDLAYVWTFNSRRIDVFKDPHYRLESSQGTLGLYIRNAQFRHAGEYHCSAVTPIDKATATGRLTVIGPPGEPAGVYADTNGRTSHSMRIFWFPGAEHGSAVDHYIVEAAIMAAPAGWVAEYPYDWKIYSGSIPNRNTIVEGDDGRGMHSTVVEGLTPGNSYRIRVRAINTYGIGEPSLSTGETYATLPAAPAKAPDGVGGGGGSVGDLTINWTPLQPPDHGGENLGYNVFWKRKTTNAISEDERWNKAVITDWKQNSFVHLVGRANYYLEYEVKVQAWNIIRGVNMPGPNSSIVIIFSAEDMPMGVPLNVQADGFNSTAMEVFWDVVPDTRETMKGKVLGYQVNYWSQDDDLDNPENKYLRYIRFAGQVESGVCIGLWENSNFFFDVQVFNSAGLGPISERFMQETPWMPPLLYPQEFQAHSFGEESVRLTWRGVSVTRGEATVSGYRVWSWPASDDYRISEIHEVDAHTFQMVIPGLEKGKVYAARVAATGVGGDGKKCPTIFFTLQGEVRYDPTVAEIRAGGSATTYSFIIYCLCHLVLLIMSKSL